MKARTGEPTISAQNKAELENLRVRIQEEIKKRQAAEAGRNAALRSLREVLNMMAEGAILEDF
tara:strand:+ start:3277 stop:3465 length:189 start_codon:yes stop_codon:yes gene_type:complete